MRTYMILCILVVVFIRDPTAGADGYHTKNCEDSNRSRFSQLLPEDGGTATSCVRVCVRMCVFSLTKI